MRPRGTGCFDGNLPPYDSCISIPLHGARRAMAAALPLPPAGQRRHFRGISARPGPACAVIVGLPPSAQKQKRKAKEKAHDAPRRKQEKTNCRPPRPPTPPSPPGRLPTPFQPPRCPPPPPQGRLGLLSREPPGPWPLAPFVAGMVTSTPLLPAAPPSSPCTRPPARREVPGSLRTSPSHVDTGGPFPSGTPRQGTGGRL